MLLSFITPLIVRDFPVFLENLKVLRDRLILIQNDCPNFEFEFYIVLQETNCLAFQEFQEAVRQFGSTAIVINQDKAGVSSARNKALYAISIRPLPCYVLFFDARIEYSAAFLRNLVSVCDAGSETIIFGIPLFSNNHTSNVTCGNASFQRDLSDILGNTYIWNMAFFSKILKGVYFDESRGPGGNTNVKSGEDALFLNEVLYHRGSYIVCVVQGEVFHPTRAEELSKYALYASGQVDVMCLLIKDNRLNFAVRAYALLRYVLFVFASIRFLFKGAQGFKVFTSRIHALLDRH